MAQFSVTIQTPEIALGGFFSEFWKILASDKQATEEEIKRLLQETAREDHDYTVQTGQLQRATKAEGSFDIGKEIRLYVDVTQADYAYYIIEPEYYDDPFIDDALMRLRPIIDTLVQDLYETAIRKFNSLD